MGCSTIVHDVTVLYTGGAGHVLLVACRDAVIRCDWDPSGRATGCHTVAGMQCPGEGRVKGVSVLPHVAEWDFMVSCWRRVGGVTPLGGAGLLRCSFTDRSTAQCSGAIPHVPQRRT